LDKRPRELAKVYQILFLIWEQSPGLGLWYFCFRSYFWFSGFLNLSAYLRGLENFWSRLCGCLKNSLETDKQTKEELEQGLHFVILLAAICSISVPVDGQPSPQAAAVDISINRSPTSWFCERMMVRSWALRILAVELHSFLRMAFAFCAIF
jgi:hypothetical protein